MVASNKEEYNEVGTSQLADTPSILDITRSDPRFSTLATALKTADLVELTGKLHDATAFAPTNDAFAKLPGGVLETLLRPENKMRLTDLLRHHVMRTAVSCSDLPAVAHAMSAVGFPLVFKKSGSVSVSNAKIIDPDVQASNGVVHVVDEVILPPKQNIIQLAKDAGDFKTMLALFERVELTQTLEGPGPYVVLAPTDEAFESLEPAVRNRLENDSKKLKNLLLFHTADSLIFSADSKDGQVLKTLGDGHELKVSAEKGRVKIGPATLVSTDLLATNGVIHVIDQVLRP